MKHLCGFISCDQSNVGGLSNSPVQCARFYDDEENTIQLMGMEEFQKWLRTSHDKEAS